MKIQNIGFKAILVALSLSSVAHADFEPPKNRYGKSIYPFVPVSTDYIKERTRIMSEDRSYIINFNDIVSKNLSSRNTQNAINPGKKAWMSTYWPLNKGLIADPYNTGGGLRRPTRELLWKGNHKRLVKRQTKVLPNWRELENKELDVLAPSEKYDILIGDDNFTLTKKVVKYMYDWGMKKENASLSKIDKVGHDTFSIAQMYVNNGWLNADNVPYASVEEAYPLANRLRGGLTDEIAKMLMNTGEANNLKSALEMARPMAIAEQENYVIKEPNQRITTWEGVCHGWSTAAGNVPRPRKTVSFKLENGKTLRFFPDDMKALVSYMWANSLVQDGRIYNKSTDSYSGGGILMQGLRCNEHSAKYDPWGRIYDSKPDAHSRELEPRCVGVHPAIWHLGLVNIIGKQGRSFVVERKISEGVDNHPMYGYKAEYFNPYTGKYDGDITAKKVALSDEDQFKAFRNKDTTHLIGVRLTMTYLDWKRPKREETDDESKDSMRDIEMLYDLELNSDGDIVGGQWRAREVGKPNIIRRAVRKQPDFFWSVTKEWKSYFKPRTDLPRWTDGSKLPPREYKAASIQASHQKYFSTPQFGWYDRCTIVRDKKNSVTRKLPKEIRVNCEHIYERPQPLIQVVDKLIELAK